MSHIDWSLAQVQQQSSMGLSQSFPSKKGGKARPRTRFHFTMKKRPVPGSSGASLAKRPHLESGNEAHPGGKKSTGASVSTCSANTREEVGPWTLALLMCCHPKPPHHLHLQFSRLVCCSIFRSVEKHYI